jgi:hypothetical protein
VYPTNKLNSWIRYPLAIIAALLAAAFFVGLLIAALKLGELILQ